MFIHMHIDISKGLKTLASIMKINKKADMHDDLIDKQDV